MEYLKTKAEAKIAGHLYYFTGKPCKKKHISVRDVHGHCLDCAKENRILLVEKNKDKILKQSSESYYRNRDKRLKNAKDYAEKNKHKVRAVNRQRKQRLKIATPKWLSEFDLFLIEEIYSLCSLRSEALNIRFHVDHIIPLKGKNVCGLHIPNNLRIISAKENLKKSNVFK